MTTTRARVLVIDDYPQILRFIELCLRANGYEVASAGSGEEALAHIAALVNIIRRHMGGWDTAATPPERAAQTLARASDLGSKK